MRTAPIARPAPQIYTKWPIFWMMSLVVAIAIPSWTIPVVASFWQRLFMDFATNVFIVALPLALKLVSGH